MAKPKLPTQNYALSDDEGTFTGNILDNAFDPDGGDEDISVARVDDGYVRDPSGIGKGTNTFAGQYGVLEISQDGSYTYTLNPGLNLKDGETLVEDFKIKIRDGDGEYGQGFVKFTISGSTNDKPFAVDDTYTLAGGTQTGNVLANDTDPDGDVLHVGGVIDLATNTNYHITGLGPVEIKGVYGTLTISDDGNFTYEIDYTDPDTIALGGAAAVEKFAYKPHDGQNSEGNNTDYAIIRFNIGGVEA